MHLAHFLESQATIFEPTRSFRSQSSSHSRILIPITSGVPLRGGFEKFLVPAGLQLRPIYPLTIDDSYYLGGATGTDHTMATAVPKIPHPGFFQGMRLANSELAASLVHRTLA